MEKSNNVIRVKITFFRGTYNFMVIASWISQNFFLSNVSRVLYYACKYIQGDSNLKQEKGVVQEISSLFANLCI